MNQIEAGPLSEKSKAEKLFDSWKIEFPEAKDLFSHFEKNASPNLKGCKVSIGSIQFKKTTIESLASGEINNNDQVCETIKIQSFIFEEINDNGPVISLKKWDSGDRVRPTNKCLFTLSTYPNKELCNDNKTPAYRYQLNNDSSEIMSMDLRSAAPYSISEKYNDWLEENFIVDFDSLPKTA
jgi:hypothetical protein